MYVKYCDLFQTSNLNSIFDMDTNFWFHDSLKFKSTFEKYDILVLIEVWMGGYIEPDTSKTWKMISEKFFNNIPPT